MPKPKQSVKGNLVLLGVFVTPAVVALVVAHATGSAAAGWLTLALTTGLLLSAVAGLVAAIAVSHQRPTLTKTQLIWLAILVFTAAMILGSVPLLVANW